MFFGQHIFVLQKFGDLMNISIKSIPMFPLPKTEDFKSNIVGLGLKFVLFP